jgi:predicted lysophospholipase L1 biosynthesis ABC-type transport system permease subunit
VVVRALFGFDFVFPVVPVAIALAVGPALTLFFGLFGTWRALAAKPAQILRDL